MLSIHVHSIVADGMNVFYREAGIAGHPVILLLHGGIASSFQFRALMPLLARDFHVIAPDLPGHGFTSPSQARAKPYQYICLARQTLIAFVDALKLTSYALYMFDFGAAVGYRLALAHPERVTAVIAQGGNAYIQGLGKAWEPVKALWGDVKQGGKRHVRQRISWNYARGALDSLGRALGLLARLGRTRKRPPDPSRITHVRVFALTPGTRATRYPPRVLADYKSTVELYPLFQRYLREWAPRVLAIWGTRDAFLSVDGAKMYRVDVPDAEIVCLMLGIFCWRRMLRRLRLR
ncbi:Alpha beta hydrolase [Rhizoctonia solani]|uniref:Alpha beta hydrolase n=1 Tax=Rhizoctonia solani TaxID=456999 RepID=A0A8H7M6X0_9AGAM|nr:Alpha beta hydrolase [Rhizoctonia solani]